MNSENGKWDLVVAGAGPAGCALAAKVASAGRSVLLLERGSSPGEGREWIVDIEKSTFGRASVPEPDSRARWHEAERQVMVSSDRKHVIELLPSPLAPVRNREYVEQLAEWARKAGAEIRSGCRVTGPLIEGGAVTGVRYTCGGGEEKVAEAWLVADCTGLPGSVRKKTPPEWKLDVEVGPEDIVLARREVRRIDGDRAGEAGALEGFTEGVRVDRAAAMGSYSIEVIFLDTERGFVDILLGVKPDPGLPTADEWFDGLLEKTPFTGERIFGGGAPIPIRRTLDSLVGDGLLLLGDSACQVIPMHGSGTASALLGADLASRAVLEALKEERYDRRALWGYCHAFQSQRGAVMAYYYAVRRHIDTMREADVNRLIAHGLLGAREVYNGLVPVPFEPSLPVMASKLARGIRVMPLLAGFARAGVKGTLLMKHYRSYPERFDPAALEKWSSRAAKLS